MKSGYYAGIDIGTNGARLVIKDALMINKKEIESIEVQKVRIPLRLGVDVYNNNLVISEKRLIK